MKNLKTIFGIITLILFSCSKKDDAPANTTTNNGSPDIYITSREATSVPSSINSTLKIYKNGVPTIFSDGVFQFPTDITVSGSDVYIVGTIGVDTYTSGKAVLWKNNTAIILASSLKAGTSAKAVAVVGNDVYVAGEVFDGTSQSIPTLWKNGIASNPTDVDKGFIEDMAVVGNDVYVVGAGADNVAKYWKNGVPTIIGAGVGTNSIVVTNNDVYVCGNFTKPLGRVSCYWKNGVLNQLSDGNNDSVTNDIILIGSDVYVIGNEQNNNGSGFEAKLWKNGSTVFFANASNINFSKMFVKDNDLYIVGYESSGIGTKKVAKYWKNGVPTNIVSDAVVSPTPYNIYVK